MAFRLTTQERLNIETNDDLMRQLSFADIIATEDTRKPGAKPRALWMRPQEEVAARGLPANIQVVKFEVSTDEEIEFYQSVVDRLKA